MKQFQLSEIYVHPRIPSIVIIFPRVFTESSFKKLKKKKSILKLI